MTSTGPSGSKPSAIDAFITGAVDAQWQKVAMVIAKALTDERLNLADVEDAADQVAQRIAGLVRSGRLEAAGDMTDWRHGEVRLATHAPHPR